MNRVGSVLTALVIAGSACGGGSSSGAGGGGLQAGLYSCDGVSPESHGAFHWCREQTLTSTDDKVIQVLKGACDSGNSAPKMKGFGFSTARACSTAEPGCVCHTTTPAMPAAGLTRPVETYDYYYFKNVVDDPKDFGDTISGYQQAFAGECAEHHGTLSCFGAANLVTGPPGIGADGKPIGWGTFLQCSSTTTDEGTFNCLENTFPSQPLSNLSCEKVSDNEGKITQSVTDHCAAPDVPGWSCAFSVDSLGLKSTEMRSNRKWADPANHASLEQDVGLAHALCRATSGTLTFYHLNPDGTLPGTGATDAGTPGDSGAGPDASTAVDSVAGADAASAD
jgi:hypothetical protein